MKSKAGYAGGSRLGKDTNRPGGKGLACYHNMMNVADYGQLGYGEVVGVEIPKGNVRAFADQYFSLFGKDSERPDKVVQSNSFYEYFDRTVKPIFRVVFYDIDLKSSQKLIAISLNFLYFCDGELLSLLTSLRISG